MGKGLGLERRGWKRQTPVGRTLQRGTPRGQKKWKDWQGADDIGGGASLKSSIEGAPHAVMHWWREISEGKSTNAGEEDN